MTLEAHSTSGPRPMQMRDLKQIADLIEEAFGPELDAAGWAALRELRMTARMGTLLSWLSPSGRQFEDMLRGFVWVEQGQVVGNVTIQQVPQFASRYIIANVAVRKTHRGQGIASALMRLALDDIAQRGGGWAVLQVRENNDIARGMYQRLGFTKLMLEYRMQATAPQAMDGPWPADLTLRPLKDGDWPLVRALLHQALPEEARWWNPTRGPGFRRGSSSGLQRRLARWLGVGHKIRWGAFREDTLLGVLDVDVLVYDEHRVDLVLHPEVEERWSRPLLAHALRYLQSMPPRPINAVVFDYQPTALAALHAFGFKPFVVLVNMRKRIRHG